MTWIVARNYTRSWRTSVDLVVIHSTESARVKGSARAIATWFASKNAPQASSHYVVDNDEVIQCVSERNVAWAAPGANHNGIQIELVGRARHSAEQWLDGAVLARASELVAKICKRWAIPIVLVSSDGLLAAHRGVTGHASGVLGVAPLHALGPWLRVPMARPSRSQGETLMDLNSIATTVIIISRASSHGCLNMRSGVVCGAHPSADEKRVPERVLLRLDDAVFTAVKRRSSRVWWKRSRRPTRTA